MKKYLITLIPVVLLGWRQPGNPSSSGISTSPSVSLEEDLKPTTAQFRTEPLVLFFLSNHHYRKIPLTDSLSSVIYDKYLDDIDHGKMYFQAGDIAKFESYRHSFDDFLINGQLDVPFEIYNLFRKRYKERSDYIQEVLASNKSFDFTKDEMLDTDREKATYAPNKEALDALWYKYIKSEALDLKLAGKADSSSITTLRDRYKNRDRALARIRSEQVFQMYMNAYAESLDPHTSYMSPSTADRFNQDMSQSLEGIGAVLREDGNYIKIVDVIPGGPAFKGKQVNKEDKIIAVAQGDEGKMVDIVGWFVDDAVKLIKGPKGTVVRLQIVAANSLPNTPPKEIRIVREKIKLEEQRAKKEVITITQNNKDFKIGVIDIPMFYRDFEGAQHREKEFSSTTRDVQKLITELKGENIDGIIIDLRNNGGGSLTEAISLTGLFINKGPVVQVKESQGEVEVQSDTDPMIAYNGPLAVMVNRFSASASEIFAAAIQDYHRGVIVGEQSYGKGTVQTLIDLKPSMLQQGRQADLATSGSLSVTGANEKLGNVKMTVAKFYRVNGSSTQLKGVMPDLELPSAFAANEYGEGSQSSALPWDQIASSKYEETKDIDKKIVDKLKDKYKQRLKSDAELKKLVEDLEAYRKAKDNKLVSLQETKRKEERDEAEKKRAALNQLGEDGGDEDEDATTKDTTKAKDAKKKDIYLKETGRILSDLVVITKESNLAGTKKK